MQPCSVTDFVLIILTLALVWATWQQAQATRAIRELQEKLTQAETSPMLLLRLFIHAGYQLEFSNLGKYGILLTEVVEQGNVNLLPRRAFPLPLKSGETSTVGLNLPMAPQSPLPGQHLFTVRFMFGGQPEKYFEQVYMIEYNHQTNYYEITRKA
jgi:hypothetical protein